MTQGPDRPENFYTDMSGKAESVVQVARAETVNNYVTPPLRTIIPRQLPVVTSNFFNRIEELEALNTLIESNEDLFAPRKILLDGEIGVGRTNLVARWGRPLKERFPNGTIYHDLSEDLHDGRPNLIEALTKMLRSLQVPEETMCSDIPGQVDLWRSVTDDLALLVVLDNIEDSALLEYLSPSSASSTIVLITHKNVAGFLAEGAQRVRVKPFSTDHSLQLLYRVYGSHDLGDERDAATELVRLSAGRPKTLATIGSQVAATPGLTLTRLLRECESLTGPISPQTIEMVAKRAAVTALDGPEGELYRRLRHHPGGRFPTTLAVALSNTPHVDDLLNSLADKRLISHDGSGRWKLPDHVPEETGEHCDEISDIIYWHVQMAQLADVKILGPSRLRAVPIAAEDSERTPAPATVGAALEWLDGDLSNLVAMARYAANQGWDLLVVLIQQSLWSLYLHRKHPGYWEITSALAIQAAQRLGDLAIESRMRAERGRCLHEKGLRSGRLDEAIVEFERARDLAVEALDFAASSEPAAEILHRRLEASATEMLGRVYVTKQRYVEAEAAFRFAIKVNERLGLRRAVALMRQHLAGVYVATGRLREALEMFLASRTDFAELDQPRDEARLLIELADLYGQLDDTASAVSTFGDACALLESCEMHLHLAKALELSGDLELERGTPEGSIESWGQALQIHKRQHNGASPDAKRLSAKLAEHDGFRG